MLRESNDDEEQRPVDGDSWSVAIWEGQKTPEEIFARDGNGGLNESEHGGAPIHASWPPPSSSSSSGGSRDRRWPSKDNSKDDDVGQSMRLMGLGTIFVVGAVAANVFAFRRSKWAVGKELHRAYERQQAYHARQQARRSASSRAWYDGETGVGDSGSTADEATANSAREKMGNCARSAREAAADAARAASTRAANAARAAAERAARAAAQRAARMTAERMAQAQAEAEQMAQERAAQEAARRRRGRQGGVRWESWTSDNGQYSRRVSMNAEDIEDLLRQMGAGSGGAVGRGGANRRQAGGRTEADAGDILDELFRAMGAGGAPRESSSQRKARAQQDRAQTQEFDAMFEEMFRAAREASQRGGGGFQGFGTFGGFGGFEGQWPGVHQQGDFGYAQHYRTLGLEPGADAAAVKAAYRKLVMKYHPDRYRGDDAEGAARRFREVTQAYEALTKK